MEELGCGEAQSFLYPENKCISLAVPILGNSLIFVKVAKVENPYKILATPEISRGATATVTIANRGFVYKGIVLKHHVYNQKLYYNPTVNYRLEFLNVLHLDEQFVAKIYAGHAIKSYGFHNRFDSF